MPSSTSSSLNSAGFISLVLGSRPAVAIFDCDGTLWGNNSGEDFFYWSMAQGMVSAEIERWAKQRYEEYRAGKVGEETMCGEMTTMYSGLKVSELEAAAARFFAEVVKPNYFLEMRALTLALRGQGCELWAVSSTNEWVVREGVKDFGIPGDSILAATAKCEAGIVRDELTRMPSGEGKARSIREVVQRNSSKPSIDAVFGNSVHDAAMMRMAGNAYAVNPNPDLAVIAEANGWTIYWPQLTSAR